MKKQRQQQEHGGIKLRRLTFCSLLVAAASSISFFSYVARTRTSDLWSAGYQTMRAAEAQPAMEYQASQESAPRALRNSDSNSSANNSRRSVSISNTDEKKLSSNSDTPHSDLLLRQVTNDESGTLVSTSAAAESRRSPDRLVLENIEEVEIKNRTQQIELLKTLQPPSGDYAWEDATDPLPFGLVMRQLGERFLGSFSTDQRPGREVVVATGDAPRSVGKNLLRMAKRKGHETHDLRNDGNATKYLDQWWLSVPSRPSNILLTVIDQPSTHVFSSEEAASAFLGPSGPTLQYIIVSVTAVRRRVNSPYSYNYTLEGVHMVRHLMNHQYKIQLLSATDFWNAADLEVLHPSSADLYMPNDLITDDNLYHFFQWGAKAAATSRAMFARDNDEEQPALFKAYLFCTRGLDLAIPSRREYLINGSMPGETWDEIGLSQGRELERMVRRVPFKTCVDSRKFESNLSIAFKKRRKQQQQNPWNAIKITCSGVRVTQEAYRYRNQSDAVQLVVNTMSDASKAESICVKLSCQHMLQSITRRRKINNSSTPGSGRPIMERQVACATRIIVPPEKQNLTTNNEIMKVSKMVNGSSNLARPLHIAKVKSSVKKPNILVLMLQSLSRSQFQFIMPRTYDLVNDMSQYARFDKYTAIGDTPESNQAALLAGARLDPKTNKPITRWIWDRLNDLGYATFNAANACPRASAVHHDAAQSTSSTTPTPTTTHGGALADLFCFHFARPNCVGDKLAAEYLLDHTKQFMEAYDSSQQTPWAAFVSLVDTREDTHTLGAVIDTAVQPFLNQTLGTAEHRKDTVVLVLSDQGLNYGSYFQTTQGKRERSQPLLYMRIPQRLGGLKLEVNQHAWITPFDVHTTLLNFAGLDGFSEGTSLYHILSVSRQHCIDALAIPTWYCDMLQRDSQSRAHPEKRDMSSPASVMSFFADIPRDHRLKNSKCKPLPRDMNATFVIAKAEHEKALSGDVDAKVCTCSTSHRQWFPCHENPWGKQGRNFPDETFLMLKCTKIALQYETRVIRNENLIAQLKSKFQFTEQHLQPPSIMILEVDSVSVAFADRHFPKTRAVLKSYRVSTDNQKQKCRNGLCGVDFPHGGVVGPNSIANQVASLSGCFTTQVHPSCFTNGPAIGDICQDPALIEFGMELKSLGPNRHTVYCPREEKKAFLYDIAQEHGYVTFFGEEFCHPGSPWVVQDNVFPVKADIEIHSVFCRLAKLKNPTTPEDQLYTHATGNKCSHGRGVGKRLQEIGLDTLDQMWDAYGDMPKFAYLNALAAHVYTPITPMQALDAEDYDETLSRFLLRLFERARNTIFVVRSDHGLQGGITHTVDYSTQVEQRQPWTEIVLPETYFTERLLQNSGKRVLPYDLYATVRGLMESRNDTVRHWPWATNLLQGLVQVEKTCADRKLVPDYCPTDVAPFPTFGVCNMYEAKQAIYCQEPTNGGPCHQRKTESRLLL